MTDSELIDALHYLGIDETNCRIMVVLPLVQVAWADGKVQPEERDAIVEIAKVEDLVHGDGEKVLDGWLAHSPTQEYFSRGHEVLVELARRGGGMGSKVTPDTIDSIIVYSENVAKAAGGLFGVLFTVDAREKRALKEIAEALKIAPGDPPASHAEWDSLVDELDK